MEKGARRAFVNSCCNQNCQGMFVKELSEVSIKAQQTTHDDDDNTEVAPSTPKYMRKKNKVRGDHLSVPFLGRFSFDWFS
jgi:hypothetical protein